MSCFWVNVLGQEPLLERYINSRMIWDARSIAEYTINNARLTQ